MSLNWGEGGVVFADSLLESQPAEEPQRPPKCHEIKFVVAQKYCLRIAELESKSRARRCAWPRQIAMYLCRDLTSSSYPQIAWMFGKRDHTTVLFAYRKIAALALADPDFDAELRELRETIRARVCERVQRQKYLALMLTAEAG